MATRRELFETIYRAALPLYGEAEARTIAEMIVMERGGISRNTLIVEPDAELSIPDIDSITKDIASWRPVQYILGRASFSDMELEVGEGVLVPRPETEELVEWIAEEASGGERVVDVCSGSGCIALALARRITEAKVVGIELSSEAIAIARRNAARYAPDVAIVCGDALADFGAEGFESVDVVVSNPPYIPESERGAMRRNVTDFEPAMALFVPDTDPLCFYRAIARRSMSLLCSGGRLYFEIHEIFAREMEQLLRDEGYDNIRLRHDFRDRPRMICATKN